MNPFISSLNLAASRHCRRCPNFQLAVRGKRTRRRALVASAATGGLDALGMGEVTSMEEPPRRRHRPRRPRNSAPRTRNTGTRRDADERANKKNIGDRTNLERKQASVFLIARELSPHTYVWGFAVYPSRPVGGRRYRSGRSVAILFSRLVVRKFVERTRRDGTPPRSVALVMKLWIG